jgi:hypothetical protein
MASEDPGPCALAALDRALAARPEIDGHAFSAATEALARLRERLIGELRSAPDPDAARRRLERVNAVISLVLAGHFPLGGVPWEEIGRARAWLAELVAPALP